MSKNTKRKLIVCEKLFLLRTERHVTQDQVAEVLGVSRSTVAKYETSLKPPLKSLEKLSEYYNVSYEYLIDDECTERTALRPSSGDQTRLTFASPNAFEGLPILEPDYDLSELPNDVRMLVECYLGASEDKKTRLLTLALENEEIGSES